MSKNSPKCYIAFAILDMNELYLSVDILSLVSPRHFILLLPIKHCSASHTVRHTLTLVSVYRWMAASPAVAISPPLPHTDTLSKFYHKKMVLERTNILYSTHHGPRILLRWKLLLVLVAHFIRSSVRVALQKQWEK